MPAMTVGTLSRRTGVPVKAWRDYQDAGLIYTVGRTAGNYRLQRRHICRGSHSAAMMEV